MHFRIHACDSSCVWRSRVVQCAHHDPLCTFISTLCCIVMNRGQLFFLVLVNAMVSLVIALAVVWAFEARRPDPEELAAINTPRPTAILAVQQAASTATIGPVATQAGDAVATETPTPDLPVNSEEQV